MARAWATACYRNYWHLQEKKDIGKSGCKQMLFTNHARWTSTGVLGFMKYRATPIVPTISPWSCPYNRIASQPVRQLPDQFSHNLFRALVEYFDIVVGFAALLTDHIAHPAQNQ